MRHFSICIILGVVFAMMAGVLVHRTHAQTGQAAGSNVKHPEEESSQQGKIGETTTNLSEVVAAHPRVATLLTALFVIGVGALFYYARRFAKDPFITTLGPSFFFWLGIVYLTLLLLLAVAYNMWVSGPKGATPVLLGSLPIAVPWFGALGAVTISLEGVFLWNSQWDTKYNYWHIGRPLFGAVLGTVAFFIFVSIVTASGTSPKFLDAGGTSSAKDFIVYYVVAFLVGYREETFRELIKRATDLILRPSAQPPVTPEVTLKVGGVTPPEVVLPNTAANATSHVTVEVQNTGSAPLMAPAVAIGATAPAPAATFSLANDQVTGGGNLAPGEVKTIEVTFTPQAPGNFLGTLTVTGTNLPTPKTIRISGRGM